MKKSTKLLTIPIILGAIFLGLPAPAVNADISPNTPIRRLYSLMECARVSFAQNGAISDSLTDEQLAEIEEISPYSYSSYLCSSNYPDPIIINMDGLEKLTSLETFSTNIGNISSVDFSHNPNLKTLSLEGIDYEANGDHAESILSSINLSNNLKLEALYLMGNPIEFLDLSNNSELKELLVTGNPLVETGITPEKDGDKLVYNLSSLKFLTPNDDGTLYFPICDNIIDYDNEQYYSENIDNIDCNNEHITYDEENMILYVDNLEAIGGEVQTFRCLLEVCESPFRLKLNEPKEEPEEEPEEDTLLSPDTGSFTEDLSAANMTFPAIGIILGALATGLLGYKKNKIKE